MSKKRYGVRDTFDRTAFGFDAVFMLTKDGPDWDVTGTEHKLRKIVAALNKEEEAGAELASRADVLAAEFQRGREVGHGDCLNAAGGARVAELEGVLKDIATLDFSRKEYSATTLSRIHNLARSALPVGPEQEEVDSNE